jgi:hypothetical protein
MSEDSRHREDKNAPAILPTDDPRDENKQDGLISKMQAVKAACDEAPDGAKKSNALKHCQSAERAQESGDEAQAMRELDAATRALT